MAVKTKIDFETLVLKSGGHAAPSSGMCVMEAVAYFRGLKHTDRPPCVSPAIGAFLRSWNDSLNDADRQMLKPYVFKVPGTNTTPEDELKRAWLATDWLVRTFAPAWLDLAGLGSFGNQLRELPELTSDELAMEAQPIIDAARWAARSAAESAAEWAARSAAESAARWAAGSAARSAAESAARWAARSAAESAARSAAESAAEWAAESAAEWAARWAAESAAESAAEKALAPTVAALQKDALRLLERMIEVGRTEPAEDIAA